MACLPTHPPGSYLPKGKADYRPAGLGFGRAGLAPAGRRTEFTEVTARLPPSGPALPGRTVPPFFRPFGAEDGGYDITDYYAIDPRLGTLGDFVEFMHQAGERGIR